MICSDDSVKTLVESAWKIGEEVRLQGIGLEARLSSDTVVEIG